MGVGVALPGVALHLWFQCGLGGNIILVRWSRFPVSVLGVNGAGLCVTGEEEGDDGMMGRSGLRWEGEGRGEVREQRERKE